MTMNRPHIHLKETGNFKDRQRSCRQSDIDIL